MTTPEEWLADFTARLDTIKAKAAEFDPTGPSVTESAPDGSISVSVAPTGALTGLRIDDSAWHGSGDELAREILRLAHAAQRVALAEALGVDAVPAAGDDGPARRRSPAPDDEDFGDERIFGGGTSP